jgi:hypothetical protein
MVMSFGMVLHYVVGAQYDTGEEFLKNVTLWYACPWTLSTAVVLLGSVGMLAIGAIMIVLGKHESATATETTDLARLLCMIALVGMFLTGYVGYFVIDHFWPKFYYLPVKDGKNVWLFMQLACMVLYAIGVFIAFNGIRRASHSLA